MRRYLLTFTASLLCAPALGVETEPLSGPLGQPIAAALPWADGTIATVLTRDDAATEVLHWLWDLETDTAVEIGEANRVQSVVFGAAQLSADGSTAAFTVQDGHLYDAAVPSTFDGDTLMHYDIASGVHTAVTNSTGGYAQTTGIISSPFSEHWLRVSPDGRHLVFATDVGGMHPDQRIAAMQWYAWDSVDAGLTLLTPNDAAVRIGTGTLPDLFMLADGRLITSLPFGDDEHQAAVYANVDSPPQPYYTNVVDGVARDVRVVAVTPDGRYLFLEEDPHSNTKVRIDTHTGERQALCRATYRVFSCFDIEDVSADGRFVLYDHVIIEDIERGQIIELEAGMTWRAVKLFDGGEALFAADGERLVRRPLGEATLDLSVERRIVDGGDDDGDDVYFDIEVANLGGAPVSTYVGFEYDLAPNTAAGTRTLTTEARVCNAFSCHLDELAPGETALVQARWQDVRFGTIDTVFTLYAADNWMAGAAKQEVESTAVVEVPPPPAPPPAAPILPSGGGRTGWWWLALLLVGIGGRYWDRTSDPCRVKAVLYR